jgi:chromosome segregation ATPase
VNQALLGEIRQLRQDLQMTAAAIQRVQLVMFRMQSATETFNRATQRLNEARNACTWLEPQRKMLLVQIEHAETRQRTAPSVDEQRLGVGVAQLKAQLDALATRQQECHSELIDAENQHRAEQAKMNDIQYQFDKLDRALADLGHK